MKKNEKKNNNRKRMRIKINIIEKKKNEKTKKGKKYKKKYEKKRKRKTKSPLTPESQSLFGERLIIKVESKATNFNKNGKNIYFKDTKY